jgi:hypothetical protein
MTIGFASGNFYKILSEESIFSFKNIKNLKAGGLANAIELHCPSEKIVDSLIKKENMDLSSFFYVSFHVPNIADKKREELRSLLDKLREVKEKYNVKNFVFHVERGVMWDVLNEYLDLSISIENMDDEKREGKSIEDIREILSEYPFNLTLDLQHCFTNNSSMKLAIDFQDEFKDRIAEYHISGFKKGEPHYPLFKTKQDIIIKSLLYKNTPIIIESAFESLGEEKKELNYILKKIQ